MTDAMTWEEYYDKFYDWSENNQIKKLSLVGSLGPADEVTEVMMELAFNHPDVVDGIAKKAIEQKLIFSADNILDISDCIDGKLLGQIALQSVSVFTRENIQSLEGILDDDVFLKLCKKKGISDLYEELPVDNVPKMGLFGKLAMVFAIGSGVRRGINNKTDKL